MRPRTFIFWRVHQREIRIFRVVSAEICPLLRLLFLRLMWVFLDFIAFYCFFATVLLGFEWVLLGFEWVLLGFTGFYWVIFG